jgi:predicted RNase H-like HicB family nuclease
MGKVTEITVVFLRIETEDWFAYLEERPQLHARGKRAKEAFCKLHGALEQYDQQRYSAEIQPRTGIPFIT